MRKNHIKNLHDLLEQFPAVAVVGARQVGKTTLAQVMRKQWYGGTHYFDLESTSDLVRLADAMLVLSLLKGLVILDELQRKPKLFPTLRVFADRNLSPASFLILGSARPSLLKQSSESLADVLHTASGLG